MKIVNFGDFKYDGMRDLVNEDGLFWYGDVRPSIMKWDQYGNFVSSIYGAWASVHEDGMVEMVVSDPSHFEPSNHTVLGIDATPEDVGFKPGIGMRYEGGELVHPATQPPTQDDYSQAVQAALDAKARERQYDGIQTGVSYRDDPNPAFSVEGEALYQWRSKVWTYALGQLAEVKAGKIEPPTVADLVADLPTFAWPDEAPAS